MSFKFYLATRVENWALANEVADLLCTAGWVQTYRWAEHGDNGNIEGLDEGTRRKVAVREVDGVTDADVLVVLMPGGRGTHCELGMALGLGRPVFLWARNKKDLRAVDGKLTSFYSHPNVVVCICPEEELLKNLLAWGKQFRREEWTRL